MDYSNGKNLFNSLEKRECGPILNRILSKKNSRMKSENHTSNSTVQYSDLNSKTSMRIGQNKENSTNSVINKRKARIDVKSKIGFKTKSEKVFGMPLKSPAFRLRRITLSSKITRKNNSLFSKDQEECKRSLKFNQDYQIEEENETQSLPAVELTSHVIEGSMITKLKSDVLQNKWELTESIKNKPTLTDFVQNKYNPSQNVQHDSIPAQNALKKYFPNENAQNQCVLAENLQNKFIPIDTCSNYTNGNLLSHRSIHRHDLRQTRRQSHIPIMQRNSEMLTATKIPTFILTKTAVSDDIVHPSVNNINNVADNDDEEKSLNEKVINGNIEGVSIKEKVTVVSNTKDEKLNVNSFDNFSQDQICERSINNFSLTDNNLIFKKIQDSHSNQITQKKDFTKLYNERDKIIQSTKVSNDHMERDKIIQSTKVLNDHMERDKIIQSTKVSNDHMERDKIIQSTKVSNDHMERDKIIQSTKVSNDHMERDKIIQSTKVLNDHMEIAKDVNDFIGHFQEEVDKVMKELTNNIQNIQDNFAKEINALKEKVENDLNLLNKLVDDKRQSLLESYKSLKTSVEMEFYDTKYKDISSKMEAVELNESVSLAKNVAKNSSLLLGTPMPRVKRRLTRSQTFSQAIQNSPVIESNCSRSEEDVSPFTNLVGNCERPSLAPMTPKSRSNFLGLKSNLNEQLSLLFQ